MKMPQLFRKEISIKPNRIKFNHSNDFLLLGSCFTQNIRKHLSFNGFSNYYPFGTLYNPITIVNNLNKIIDNQRFMIEVSVIIFSINLLALSKPDFIPFFIPFRLVFTRVA